MTTTLIADDELDMRLLVRITLDLSNLGFNVVCEATNGQEAVEAYTRDGPMDVVILDNRMPMMTGLDAARAILAANPTQLVVLYSAHLDPQVEREAAEIGIRACVSKVDLEQLPDRLLALIRNG